MGSGLLVHTKRSLRCAGTGARRERRSLTFCWRSLLNAQREAIQTLSWSDHPRAGGPPPLIRVEFEAGISALHGGAGARGPEAVHHRARRPPGLAVPAAPCALCCTRLLEIRQSSLARPEMHDVTRTSACRQTCKTTRKASARVLMCHAQVAGGRRDRSSTTGVAFTKGI